MNLSIDFIITFVLGLICVLTYERYIMADFDVNSLLDGTLDDLADVPEFKPYPAGSHVVIINWVDKTKKADWINGHPGYELKMKYQEPVELSDATQVPPEKNAETSVLYLLDNELGQGKFKQILAVASEKFGAMSNRELIAASQNATCVVVTKQRSNKDKTQTYTDIVEIQFA